MATQWDPEQAAVQSLHSLVDLADARVLDVGCGKGHRTGCYADAARWVVGVDPSTEALAIALQELPAEPGIRMALAQARAESLPFPSDSFDVAILGWSL